MQAGTRIADDFYMIITSRRNKHARQFVERKLAIRLRIFFIVMILLLGTIVYEVSDHYISLAKATIAFATGIVLGIVFVRRKKIFWEEEMSLVVARMDTIGIILFVVYILYVVFRHIWLAHWFFGHELSGFSYSLAAGTMTGRVASMRTQIRQVLKHQKIL